MIEVLKRILEIIQRYSTEHSVAQAFGLKANYRFEDICTPTCTLSGSSADSCLMKEYIQKSTQFARVLPDIEYIDEFMALALKKDTIRKASVFCTLSVALEYTHPEEIISLILIPLKWRKAFSV